MNFGNIWKKKKNPMIKWMKLFGKMTNYQRHKISLDKLSKIVEMSDMYDRPEIAKTIQLSTPTVWKYQKQLKLV